LRDVVDFQPVAEIAQWIIACHELTPSAGLLRCVGKSGILRIQLGALALCRFHRSTSR
jgi:hypothetical protein